MQDHELGDVGKENATYVYTHIYQSNFIFDSGY